MAWFLYIAGTINCIIYLLSAKAYATANTQAFEDVVPGALMLVTACIALVLTIVSGAVALSRKGESWRFWLATLVCTLPMIMLALHAANRAAHPPVAPNHRAGVDAGLAVLPAIGYSRSGTTQRGRYA